MALPVSVVQLAETVLAWLHHDESVEQPLFRV
jgi:hypothetical protein